MQISTLLSNGSDVFPKFLPVIRRVLVLIDAWFGRVMQSEKGLTPFLIAR